MRRNTNKAVLTSAMALAILAGAATTSADDACRWELKIKRKAILSDNFEVELWAHVPDDVHAFAGAHLDLLTSGVDWIDVGDCLLGLGHIGDIVGDDVRDIEMGQIHFPPAMIYADTTNPIRVWCGEFEAQGGFPYRSVLTSTDQFGYYVDESSSDTEDCSPMEALRTVFVGPIVIGDWIAATFDGTIGVPSGDGLILEAEGTAVPEIAAAITDEAASWAPGSTFEHTIDVNDLPGGATVELDWFPWWQTGGLLREGLSATMAKTVIPGGPPTIEVTPDFGDVGVPRVPTRLLLEGRVVGEPILGSGASFSLFNPCFELTWCWVLNQFDQMVLVLKCEDPFDIELGGRRYMVDAIELDPSQAPGAAGGLDRVEVRARGTRSIEITSAGFSGGACRADCDGNGELNIFDFLCFQNLFASGDLAADFDGDGRLTIFDFLEFQNAFAIGCG
ncbi:MAG: GC-type dockerin domain-anchored protein [Phycisphaerales bacterium]